MDDKKIRDDCIESMIELLETELDNLRKNVNNSWRGRTLQCKSSAIVAMDELIKIFEEALLNDKLY